MVVRVLVISIPTVDGIENDMILVPVLPVVKQGSICCNSGSCSDIVVGIWYGSGNCGEVVWINDCVAIGSGVLSEVELIIRCDSLRTVVQVISSIIDSLSLPAIIDPLKLAFILGIPDSQLNQI